MLGKLKKVEDLGWMVEIDGKDYELHPDDVETILELQQIFDNLDARIIAWPEEEFDIVEHQKLTGVVKYAKINKDGRHF